MVIHILYVKKQANSICWTCRNRKICKGSLLTDWDEGNPELRTPHDPTCLPDPAAIVVSREKGKLKGNVVENIHQTVPFLHTRASNEIAAYGEIVAARWPPLQSVSSSLNRARQADRPPLPHALGNVMIPDIYATTSSDENFVLYRSEDNSIIIFGTVNNLRQLGRLREWSFDGTFDAIPTPKLWAQLFTVHAFSGEKLLPLLYCLLTRKTRDEYIRVLRIIRDLAGNCDPPINLNPTTFRCDFETGLLPALRQEFPGVDIQGCHFHYTQAIWRNFQRLGFTNLYAENEQAHMFVKCLFALAFVPLNDVQATYDLLIAQLPQDLAGVLQPLMDYFVHQWFGMVPLTDWNVWDQMRRTNNNLEGWHSRMKKLMKINPDFYSFLKGINTEQGQTTVFIAQIAAGVTVVRKNKVLYASMLVLQPLMLSWTMVPKLLLSLCVELLTIWSNLFKLHFKLYVILLQYNLHYANFLFY